MWKPLGLIIFAVLVFPSPAAAGVVSKLVMNRVNELEDDDFEMLVNAGRTITAPGTDTRVDVGDFIAGIIRISALRVPAGSTPPVASFPQPSPTFTGIFVQKVLSVTKLLGGVMDGINDVVITMGAPTLADWAGLGLPAHLIPENAGTIGIMFDDPDDLNQSLARPLAFASVNGTKLWEFGFKGLPGERWTAQTDTDRVNTAFRIVTGNFSGNLNVTGYYAGPKLLPQPVVGGFADVLVRNGSIGAAAPGSSFPISSDTDILILPTVQPVPEPGSVLIWGGLAATWVAVRRRQRKS
jgi:hypothetical protein